MKHGPHHIILRTICALTLALGLGGAPLHTAGAQSTASSAKISQGSAPKHLLNWQQRVGVLRVGILAPHNANRTLLNLRPFQRLLQDKLAVRIELFALPDEQSLLQAFSEGRIDYAPLSTSAYIALRGLCKCVEPIVMPARLDGGTSFRVALFASGEKATSLAALQGARIAVPGRHSFAGYVAPRSLMRDRGVGFETAKWEVFDYSSPLEAARALVKGKADGLLGWVAEAAGGRSAGAADTRALLSTMSGPDDFKPVWTSAPIHHGPHVVRSALPMPARQALQTLLATLARDHRAIYKRLDPVHGGGLKPSVAHLYDDIANAILRANTSVAGSNSKDQTIQ